MINLQNKAAEAVAYAIHRVIGDRAIYTGPLASDLVKDDLIVQSKAPSRTRTSYGNRKSSLNLVTSTTVANIEGVTHVLTRKLELVVSAPVGTTDAEYLEDKARLASLSDADYLAIVKTGKIEI